MPAYGFYKSPNKFVDQKFRDFCQMFVISKKKTIPQGMDLKIYIKSIALPMDFNSL